jgi:hypothetical protein
MICSNDKLFSIQENTENLAQHARNLQERETQEVDEKEVSISEKQKSDKDLTLWLEFFATQDVQMFDYHDSVTV